MFVCRFFKLFDLLQLPDESADGFKDRGVKHQRLSADRGRPDEKQEQLVEYEWEEVDETLSLGRLQALDGIAHFLLDPVLLDVTRKPSSLGATGEEEEMIQTLVLIGGESGR